MPEFCDYHVAKEELDMARNERRESTTGDYRRVSKGPERVAHDARVVLLRLKRRSVQGDSRGTKRRLGVILPADEGSGPTTAPESGSHLCNELLHDKGPRLLTSERGSETDCSNSPVKKVISLVASAAAGLSTSPQTSGLVASNPHPQLTLSSMNETTCLLVDMGEKPPPQDARANRSNPHIPDNHRRSGCDARYCASPPMRARRGSGTEKLALNGAAVKEQVIDVDALPDSGFEQSPTDTLLHSALLSLQRRHCLTTEAVLRTLKLFNPDISTWYIIDPSIANSDASTHRQGVQRFYLLDDCHKNVVVPVNCEESHWTIGIVKREEKTFRVYDSMNEERYMRATQQQVERCATSLPELCALGSVSDGPWTQVGPPLSPGATVSDTRVPESPGLCQTDAHSCGIYAAVWAIHAMHEKAVPAMIEPDIWRYAIMTALAAQAGSGVDDERMNEFLPHDLVTGSMPSGMQSNRFTFMTFNECRRPAKAASSYLREGEKRKAEFSRILRLVDIVYDANLQRQKALESKRRTIAHELRLLNQPLSQRFRATLGKTPRA